MTGLAYKRSVGLKFGPASPAIAVDLLNTISPDPFKGLQRSYGNKDDDGIRVQFDILRTLAPEPDRAKITLWNLSEAAQKAIESDYQLRQTQRKVVFSTVPTLLGARAKALNLVNNAHKVGIFAGYQGDPQGIFFGDYLSIGTRQRDGFTDFKTVLEVGDSALLTRDAYLDNPVGPGTTVSQLITSIVTNSGAALGPNAAVTIAKITPTTKIQAFTGGAVGNVPADEALTDLDFLGKTVHWWKDGPNGPVLELLGDDDVLPDFAIAVVEGRDLLDFSKGQEDGDLQIRTNLNAGIEPGRAIYLYDAMFVPKGVFKCTAAQHVGDTEGNDWYSEANLRTFLGPPPPPDLSALA